MNDSAVPPTPPEQPPQQPAPTAEAAPKKKGGWGKWVALGCGCLLVVTIAVAAIIAAIAIPAYMKVNDASKDLKAVTMLRNGVMAAATYYADNNGSYEGLSAGELSKVESSVPFADGAPGPDLQVGTVYLDKSAVTANGYALTTKSESGKLIRVTQSSSGMKFEQSDNGVTWSDLAPTR